MHFNEAESLLKKLRDGQLSDEERNTLESWYLQWNPGYAGNLTEAEISNAVAEIRKTLPKAPVRRMKVWGRMAAAACLVLIAGAVVYQVLIPEKPAEEVRIAEVLPASGKAVLTTEDGRSFDLSDSGTRILSSGEGEIVQSGASLAYQYSDRKSRPEYHTLSTPRGGIFEVRLQDGTKVWLNAASSIRYPSFFNGKERVIEIKGEAYFEVAQDKDRAFRVKTEDVDVEVLGTRFNINSYTVQNEVVTTLLEGAVRVRSGQSTSILKPGQQALAKNFSVQIAENANLSEVMAWKNGLFNFNQKGIKEVMSQLSMWYDIDVEYPSGIPDIRFFGEIERGLPLKTVLAILEKSNLKFELKGRTLFVYP